MQLQNIFYYIRFVNGIHDDIFIFGTNTHIYGFTMLCGVFLVFVNFSMFHRMIIIFFTIPAISFKNVMVDSCLGNTPQSYQKYALPILGNDAFHTFTWLSSL